MPRSIGALLALAVGLALAVAPAAGAWAGDPFAPFGGKAAYVASQQLRYRAALARWDADLLRRLEADALRVGYALPLYPLTFTDDAGRQVRIPAQPWRIVSLAPSNTEILFAIGAGPRVVGVDSFSDYPEEAKRLPRLGGVTDTNFEKIVELRPDLALTIGGTEKQVKKLEELGVRVVVLQPRTLEDVFAKIETVGRLVGEIRGAHDVVRAMRQRVAAVRAAVGGVPPERRPRVFYEVWYDPIFTVGPGGFIHDVIVTAGGVNVFADARQDWPQVTLEEVVRRDPEVIITPFKQSYEQLVSRQRPGWEGVAAVKRGRILLIDPNIVSRPGPRLVEGLEQIARFLHPDRFR